MKTKLKYLTSGRVNMTYKKDLFGISAYATDKSGKEHSAKFIAARPGWGAVYDNYPIGFSKSGIISFLTGYPPQQFSDEEAGVICVSIALIRAGMLKALDVANGEIKRTNKCNKWKGSKFIGRNVNWFKDWLFKVWGKADKTIEANGSNALATVRNEIYKYGKDNDVYYGVYIIIGRNGGKNHASLWVGGEIDVIDENNCVGTGGTVYFWGLKGRNKCLFCFREVTDYGDELCNRHKANKKPEEDRDIIEKPVYGSPNVAAMAAANVLYHHIIRNGTVEYGIGIYEKNEKEYYLAETRLGTPTDVKTDDRIGDDRKNGVRFFNGQLYKFAGYVHSHPTVRPADSQYAKFSEEAYKKYIVSDFSSGDYLESLRLNVPFYLVIAAFAEGTLIKFTPPAVRRSNYMANFNGNQKVKYDIVAEMTGEKDGQLSEEQIISRGLGRLERTPIMRNLGNNEPVWEKLSSDVTNRYKEGS
ncbi:MAG: type VI secretion system amidase effector protein Tae4 [Chitinispirillales bacterium]|nr:type VI secretion system amidase effector protein Tae4 [Chitinispirillales bacterium]